jgi:hypothetical protein
MSSSQTVKTHQYIKVSPNAFCRLRRREPPREFGAASPRDFKTAKELGKTTGLNHVLGERRKEKFLIIRSKIYKLTANLD